MTDQALIGRTLGHYRIEQQLGDGSMSSVFRATDVRLKRPVAIKVMHPHMAARSEFQQRFAQEARAAKRLDHASIVRVLDSGFDQGYLYLVMELVTGGSLRAYLQRLQTQHKAIELTEALELTRQIAEALDYAHREGMIHRDIKPDNVLLKLMTGGGHGTSRFRAVLTDFGLAKLAEGGVHSLTGQPMGTLPYMSPEQCLAEKVDARTDIYALGVMMYELVVGRLPYEPRSITQAIQMHTRDPLPPPSEFRPDLPADVVAILKKSLAKHPNDRFQQAGEMARAIQAVQTRIASGEPTMPEASSGPGENLKTYLMGEPIPAQMPEHTYQTPTPSMAGYDRLIIVHEQEPTRTVPLKQAVTLIGRALNSDVVLDGEGVSRSHARLERGADGRYRITDLGSTNGTLLGDARLMPQVPEVWDPDATVRIGAFWLQLEASGVQPTRPRGMGSMQYAGAPSSGGSARATFQGTSGVPVAASGRNVGLVMTTGNVVEVQAGGRVDVPVEILNQDRIVDHFTVQVRGLLNEWVTVPTKTLQLMPGDQGTIMVAFHPPRTSTSVAGRHSFVLSVTSREKHGEVASLTGWLQIAPFHGFKTDLQPKRVQRKGSVTLSVTNTGNAPGNYTISARDREDAVKFMLSQPEFAMGPGQTVRTLIQMEPKERPIIGVEKALPYEIEVRELEGGQESQVGELVAVPLIPYWALGLLTFLATACILIIGLALAAGLIIPPTAEATATVLAATDFVRATQNTLFTEEARVNAELTQFADVDATATNAAMTAIALGDDDRDGLSNVREAELNTNPQNPDTDGDTLTDGQEVNSLNTDPLDMDTDDDNLTDGREVELGTNPKNPDTDGDGLPDNVDPDPLDPFNPSLASRTPATPTLTLTVAPPPISPTWTPSPTPTATLAPRSANVQVTFNQLFVQQFPDASLVSEGQGYMWLDFRVEARTVAGQPVDQKLGRWPTNEANAVDLGVQTPVAQSFTVLLTEGQNLIISVDGTQAEDYYGSSPTTSMGTASRTHSSADAWGSQGGAQSITSGPTTNCPNGCFQLQYTVQVNWINP